MAEQEVHERRRQGDGEVPSWEQSEKAQVDPEKPREDPGKTRRIRIRIGAAAALLLVAGFLWWLHARKFEDTDDAQIDGNIGAISSRVPGTVTAVHVEDNQRVKAGDLLVELDTADLEVAVAQARAAVAQAQAQVEAEQPNVSITATSNRTSVQSAEDEVANGEAEVEAAQRELDQALASNRFAQQQRARAQQLFASKTVAQVEVDQRVSAAEVTAGGAAAAQKRIDQRSARLQTARARLTEAKANAPRQMVAREAGLSVRQANLELARAQLKQAELNFGYARVLAPVEGVVGKRSVNVGDRVQPGQQIFSLTQVGDLWVTANFRETQLQRMQPGQSVQIHVDAIDRDYSGTVRSFSAATGSRYSLLPPENASGNYVKVVQRIPVRIQLDPGQPEMDRLRPGMSVEPKVKVR